LTKQRAEAEKRRAAGERQD